MTDPHATPQADTAVLAEDVYNVLMAGIEPELLLSRIPMLDALYAGESPEEHEARMEKYAVAYKKFDAALKAFMTDVNGSARSVQRHALKDKEQQARSQEMNTLTSLASAFD